MVAKLIHFMPKEDMRLTYAVGCINRQPVTLKISVLPFSCENSDSSCKGGTP